MAVEDSGLPAKGWKIDVICGDHQNKPDVGVAIARQWIDIDKVDAIADPPNSGVALAVSNLSGQERDPAEFRRGDLRPHRQVLHANTVSLTYDTYMLANGTGKALTKAGGDTWFFLTADYAFGAAGARYQRRSSSQRRQGARRRQASAQHLRLLLFLLQAQSSRRR